MGLSYPGTGGELADLCGSLPPQNILFFCVGLWRSQGNWVSSNNQLRTILHDSWFENFHYLSVEKDKKVGADNCFSISSVCVCVTISGIFPLCTGNSGLSVNSEALSYRS